MSCPFDRPRARVAADAAERVEILRSLNNGRFYKLGMVLGGSADYAQYHGLGERSSKSAF
jgi:hypothetical protein